MPPSEFLPPEFPEPAKEIGQMGQSVPNARVEAQLNQPADVSQAHQFFQPRVDGALPALNLQTDGGATAAALAKIPNGIMPGGEHALSGVAAKIGAEKGALAMLAPQPGGEQISPLIQMIMKMPGLTGVMDSLFEFLKMLFEGDLFGTFTAALLDPTGMLLHLFQQGGDSFTIPMDMLTNQTPMFKFENNMFTQPDSMRLHAEAVDAANVGAPIGNVDLQQAIFEKTSKYTVTDYQQQSLLDWRGQNNLALGPDSGVYRPHMGTYQAPTGTTSGTTQASTNLSQQSNTHPGSTNNGAQLGAKQHFKTRDIGPSDQSRITQATPTDAVNGQYTVKSGDNLWDIAKHNLGDGSRWGEIYKLNSDLIGQNPDLIQPGATLQMPDGNSVASAAAAGGRYVVQSGDNLWNIAKNNLGGGQNWGEIYKLNQGVIGGNPALIQPGQQLSLDGSGMGSVASAPVTDGAGLVTTQAAPVQSAPVQSAPANAAPSPAAAAHGNPAIAHNSPALKADTARLAPVENNFANSAQVGSETTINSTTQVPADAGSPQVYTSPDGSLFYRQKPQ